MEWRSCSSRAPPTLTYRSLIAAAITVGSLISKLSLRVHTVGFLSFFFSFLVWGPIIFHMDFKTPSHASSLFSHQHTYTSVQQQFSHQHSRNCLTNKLIHLWSTNSQLPHQHNVSSLTNIPAPHTNIMALTQEHISICHQHNGASHSNIPELFTNTMSSYLTTYWHFLATSLHLPHQHTDSSPTWPHLTRQHTGNPRQHTATSLTNILSPLSILHQVSPVSHMLPAAPSYTVSLQALLPPSPSVVTIPNTTSFCCRDTF